MIFSITVFEKLIYFVPFRACHAAASQPTAINIEVFVTKAVRTDHNPPVTKVLANEGKNKGNKPFFCDRDLFPLLRSKIAFNPNWRTFCYGETQ